MYDHMAPILSTITRDKKTQRARDIRPDEQVQSIFDEISEGEVRVGSVNVHNMAGDFTHNDPRVLRKIIYNEADALEDAVLFPDELVSGEANGKFEQISSSLLKFEHGGPSLARWMIVAEFDEATSDYIDSTDDEDDPLQLANGEDEDDWPTSESEHEYVMKSGMSSDVLRDGAREASSKLSQQSHGTKDQSEGVAGNQHTLVSIKDKDSTEAALEKYRGHPKHGWENAFSAILLAQATVGQDVDPAFVNWLSDMFDVEETALNLPKDHMLGRAKWMEWMEKKDQAVSCSLSY